VKWLIRTCLALAAAGAMLPGLLATRPHSPTKETLRWTPIYHGIDYLALDLEPADRWGEGPAHLIRIDLNAEGVELVVTPPAPDDGRVWPARYPWAFAAREDLAVCVNGPMFTGRLAMPLPGGPAMLLGAPTTPNQPLITPNARAGFNPRSALLYQSEDGRVALSRWLRDTPNLFDSAILGVGSHQTAARGGRLLDFLARRDEPTRLARCTAVGLDPERQTLYLAAFARASYRRAARTLLDHGAKDVAFLDGGGSTCLTLGDHGRPAPAGVLIGGHEPVAAALGVRADPLQSPPDD